MLMSMSRRQPANPQAVNPAPPTLTRQSRAGPWCLMAPRSTTPRRPVGSNQYWNGPSLLERFWAKVDKRGPDECWLWTASADRDGYGRIGAGGAGAPMMRAHRLSWELRHGLVPAGSLVCHRCDNPPCCNPAHLFVGTVTDNNRDRGRKGRSRDQLGEKNEMAVLCADDVRQIRVLRASHGWSLARLGALFGVTGGAVRKIVLNINWRHVT